MDADDAIIATALEELYTFAEKSDADVVHCERWYVAFNENFTTDKDLIKLSNIKDVNPLFNSGFLEEPTFMTENLEERIKLYCEGRFWWAPWSHLIKRKFLVENEIEFYKLRIADDLLFTTFLMITAKKILYIPNAVYIWRVLRNSNSRAYLNAEKTIHKRAGDIFLGINILEKFLNKFDFFNESPECRQSIFDFLSINQIDYIVPIYSENPDFTLDALVRKELEEIGNSTALTAFLFGRMSVLQMNFMKQHAIIQQLQSQIEKIQQAMINRNNFFR